MIPLDNPTLWEPALACLRCGVVVGVSRIAEHEAAHAKWDDIDAAKACLAEAAKARFAEHDSGR